MNAKAPGPQASIGAIHLFWEYVKHTLLTGGIYVILVLFTLLLHYFATLMKDYPFHFKILVGLEMCIFVVGSILLFLVMVYVTAFFMRDLYRSFRTLFP
jgi:hypothetical protein